MKTSQQISTFLIIILGSIIVSLVIVACNQPNNPINEYTQETIEEPKFWETLPRITTFKTVKRTKVPNGWLVVVLDADGIAAVVVEDPEHEWKIGE